MSSFDELINIVSSTLSSNIKPQFLQITNVEVIKYVNTGDRIKDGSIVIIINALISIGLSLLYYVSHKLYYLLYYKLYYQNNNTYKINVNNVMKNVTEKDMEKYLFRYSLSKNIISFKQLNKYLEYNKIINEHYITKPTYYKEYLQCSSSNIKKYKELIKTYSCLHDYDMNGYSIIPSYFMPVEKYENEYGNYDYIFLFNGDIVSKSFIQLNKFIEKVSIFIIEQEYVEEKSNLKICETHYDITHATTMQYMDNGLVNKNITFDTIYFDEKPILLNWINKFQTKTLYPKKLSLANKLGILLYGPPGTGKTGCITALANTLNRNILIVKTLSLKLQGQYALRKLIRDNQTTHIIVFDEFDYLLTSENSDDTYQTEICRLTKLLEKATTNEEKTSIISMIDDCKKRESNGFIDVRFILELLDGISDDNGRIIIATTNNPEKINPLFLRPGRFDVILKLGYCSFQMFQDIVKTTYSDLEESFFENNRERINNILSLNITPLILINKLVVSTDIQSLLNTLENLSPKEYNVAPKI